MIIMEINITAKGLIESQRMLNHVSQTHDQVLNELLKKLGEEIIMEARNNLALKNHIDSGGLMGSIQILKEGDKEILVGSDAPHASYIEFGRGPIRPINAIVLRFFDKNTGKIVFTKYVGPTEPSPFLQPAVETTTNKFRDVYVQKMENMINDGL